MATTTDVLAEIRRIILMTEETLRQLTHPTTTPIDADTIRTVKAMGYEQIRELVEEKETL